MPVMSAEDEAGSGKTKAKPSSFGTREDRRMSKHDIEWAVRVLNEHKHESCRWTVATIDGRECCCGEFIHARHPDDYPLCQPALSRFEAIAIAEKLERQAGRDMPATRELMRSLESWAEEAGVPKCYDNGTVDVVIKATIGELRALLGEWGRKA